MVDWDAFVVLSGDILVRSFSSNVSQISLLANKKQICSHACHARRLASRALARRLKRVRRQRLAAQEREATDERYACCRGRDVDPAAYAVGASSLNYLLEQREDRIVRIELCTIRVGIK